MDFDLIETDDEASRERVLAPLEAYNEAMIGRGHSEPARWMSILRREGNLVGGLIGVWYWDWLLVDLLWLPRPWRRRGIGGRIVAACLALAARHGLSGVWLHAFSFQAPDFWRRLGFAEFATLPDHPVGQADHFFLHRTPPGMPSPPELPPGFVLRETVDPADRIALAAALRGFNDAAIGVSPSRPLGLLAPGGGGLWGRTRHRWLFVELLGLPQAGRGSGLGTGLLREAERIAAGRGCVGVYLDTCSFQAPGFYERLDYHRFGTVPEHPRGHARHLYAKRLDGQPLLAHNARPPRQNGASA
ncbi:MAG: GNAT family N-acetyltransferase [Rhodospirillales bacterium]|nr:GNAT family N-acetyltransferase [Rhodospirillales bacterium]